MNAQISNELYVTIINVLNKAYCGRAMQGQAMLYCFDDGYVRVQPTPTEQQDLNAMEILVFRYPDQDSQVMTARLWWDGIPF